MRGHVVSGISGGVVVGLMLCLLGAGRTDSVTARHVVIVNADGKTVGELGADSNGEPFLKFMDAQGNVRLRFDVAQSKLTDESKDSTAKLKLIDAKGRVAAEFTPEMANGFNMRVPRLLPTEYFPENVPNASRSDAPRDEAPKQAPRARVYLLNGEDRP